MPTHARFGFMSRWTTTSTSRSIRPRGISQRRSGWRSMTKANALRSTSSRTRPSSWPTAPRSRVSPTTRPRGSGAANWRSRFAAAFSVSPPTTRPGGRLRPAHSPSSTDVRGGPEVARAVVQHLAMKVSQRDHPPFFCACCLDLEVAAAPPEARRVLALQIAIVARRDADISEAELRSAVAGAVSRPAVERLATAERRVAVRRRLGRIGRLGSRSVQALAAELQAIAREPLPRTPAEDDVWRAVCAELLADVARPEWN